MEVSVVTAYSTDLFFFNLMVNTDIAMHFEKYVQQLIHRKYNSARM